MNQAERQRVLRLISLLGEAYKITQNGACFLCIILLKKDFTFSLICGILLLAHTICCVLKGSVKQNIAIARVRSLWDEKGDIYENH